MAGDIFGGYSLEQGMLLESDDLEAWNAAQHPTMHRTAPDPKKVLDLKCQSCC